MQQQKLRDNGSARVVREGAPEGACAIYIIEEDKWLQTINFNDSPATSYKELVDEVNWDGFMERAMKGKTYCKDGSLVNG